MNDNNKVEENNNSKNNILFAAILGLIALGVGIMPFFYLSNVTL
jgi:hypothetical protein